MITGDKISIRGSSTPPVIIIDDVIWEDVDLRDINIMDVETIEIMKGAEAAVLGSKGAGGAIILTTKRGDITPKNGIKFNMKTIMPKGYRKDVEFYSPKYETEEQMTGTDRRTTIFWKPNVKISSGNAEFDFYTADSNSTYSVIIEGITNEGQIIRTLGKIKRNEKKGGFRADTTYCGAIFLLCAIWTVIWNSVEVLPFFLNFVLCCPRF